MILRAIDIEHWCCIARLQLSELPCGIVVLHGPNRTGKSSIVKALRSCLFDYDHDTARAELKACSPWNGAGPPKVAVTFETAGELYRVTKVYSKKVDGATRLDVCRKEQWEVLESAPKEASRRTRELLGADKSDAGMNQLLWLDQGSVYLPSEKSLDTSLERRLVSVLGVMVTGRDLGFKQALDRLCETWFGATGRHRPTSPMLVWEKERDNRQKKLDEHQAKWHEVERAIQDMEECRERLPELEKEVSAARVEWEQLQRDRDQNERRRQEYLLAQKEFEAAQKQLRDAQERLKTCHEAKSRWQEAEAQAQRTERSLSGLREERDRWARELDKKLQALQQARLAEEENQTAHESIADCRKLWDLSEQRARAQAALQRAEQLGQSIAEWEQTIQKAAGPDGPALEELRANREAAAKLRVQLQAGVLTLTITPQQPLLLQLQRDAGRTETVNLAADEPRCWPIRQWGTMDISTLGTITVGRSVENLDLERAARNLEALDREFEETVRSFGEEPDDACLNRLTERRVEREAAAANLEAQRKEMRQLAPVGLGALKSEVDKCDGARRLIVQRRPELADWKPSEQEVTERDRQFQARVAVLQNARKDLEKAEKRDREELRAAEGRLRAQETRYVVERTTAKNYGNEVQRAGDEAALQALVRQSEGELGAARARLSQSELTQAELWIEQRYHDAESALKKREERLQHLKDEMNRHRGRLEASEGLHTRLADAEAAVREAEETVAREKLEADAHKRLRDLFEDSRDNQVQQVMGPIGGRVLRWSQAIGLSEYREVRFGDRFLPEGIVLSNDGVNKVHELADESYGTSEQLSLLVRLALGGALAKDEPMVAVLDDPLAHADALKHRRILDIVRMAAEGNPAWQPPGGRLQILVFTCHPERFDYLTTGRHIDLASLIVREP
jgi:hypothetical protein